MSEPLWFKLSNKAEQWLYLVVIGLDTYIERKGKKTKNKKDKTQPTSEHSYQQQQLNIVQKVREKRGGMKGKEFKGLPQGETDKATKL